MRCATAKVKARKRLGWLLIMRVRTCPLQTYRLSLVLVDRDERVVLGRMAVLVAAAAMLRGPQADSAVRGAVEMAPTVAARR